jgi:hypothetical protein
MSPAWETVPHAGWRCCAEAGFAAGPREKHRTMPGL